MRKSLFNIIDKIQSSLETIKVKYFKENNIEESNNYFQLSPIKTFSQNNQYTEALQWALKNRKEKDIKNIALTGAYGAGKSSILKTFQENNIDPDLKFLNISLATFKEEAISDDPEKPQFIEKLRQIEISILQQIFYHEEDSKIPDSRFKKIKVSSKKELTIKSISILVALISVFWLFFGNLELKNFPNFFSSIFFFEKVSLLIILGFLSFLFFLFLKDEKKIKKFYVPLSLIMINFVLILVYGIHYVTNIQSLISEINVFKSIKVILINISVLYLIIFGYLAIKELIIFINRVSVSKLTVQDVEIEIGSKHQKSIMNQHLDEILYFFSVRPYNVIIIEDLDRFKQTEIFTKLREINLILNQSEKTKDKHIAFVYAVRDEMFQDKDRTKFFDFIIPVIPTINSSNSSQILLSKNKINEYNLSEKFIESISFIIDDMRLLHNICNEFYLYKSLLSDQLDPEKLFSIITYKNIIPDDFVSLSNNDGILYRLLNSKREYILQINTTIDSEIKSLSEKLSNLEDNYYNSVVDLRRIYILKIIEQLEGFSSFVINDKTISFDNLTKDENFAYLINNSIHYNKHYASYNTLGTTLNKVGISFLDLEKTVNSNKKYKTIEKEIEQIKNNKINAIKIRIKDLENKKIHNRSNRLTNLLQDRRFNLDDEGIKKGRNDFLITLLRNGYIAEDYIEYISIFHAGSISRNDHSFFMNVQNKVAQEFNYKLDRIENLINKIYLIDFKTEYILNYNLLDFLLKNNNQYESQLANFIDKVIDESEKSISFIILCYENLENVAAFTNVLTNRWENFWTILSNHQSIESDILNKIFLSSIKFSDIENIKKISVNNSFRQKIYTNSLFLNIIEDHDRIKEIIKDLHIYFENIDFINSPKELCDFIYKNSYYEINIPNLITIIKFYGQFNQADFDSSNYKAILNSKCDNLQDYIVDSISTYISDVYLLLEKNNNEEEESYIELLNNEDLKEDYLDYIIQKVNTKITDIKSINKNDDQIKLLKNGKIDITWENVLYFVNNGDTNQELIDFLNDINNAETLSKQKVSDAKDAEGKYIYSHNYKKIIQLENIEDENLDLIIKSSPWWFDDLVLENFATEKVEILIRNRKINPNLKSFKKIRESHKNLLINLIERCTYYINEIIDSLEIDSFDLEFILKSSKLTDSLKNTFLNKLTDAEIADNQDNIINISKIKAKNNLFDISQNILILILTNKTVDHENKIKVFNNNSSRLNTQEIEQFLDSLSGSYAEILNKDKKVLINFNDDNLLLLRILEDKGYISSFKEEKNGWRIYHRRR